MNQEPAQSRRRDGADSSCVIRRMLLTADGNILPPPAITVYRLSLSSDAGDIAVVEVQPSDLPPVRYRGQAYTRVPSATFRTRLIGSGSRVSATA